jgi:hypothetical protein
VKQKGISRKNEHGRRTCSVCLSFLQSATAGAAEGQRAAVKTIFNFSPQFIVCFQLATGCRLEAVGSLVWKPAGGPVACIEENALKNQQQP